MGSRDRQNSARNGARGVTTLVAVLSLLGGLAAPGGAYVRPGGATVQIDLTWDGKQPSSSHTTLGCAGADRHAISANGRYATFASDSDDLVSNDTNNTCDVFVRNLRSGRLTRESLTSTGLQSVGDSTSPAISPNGRFIAFASAAVDLVPGDGNLASDIYLRDRRTGGVERVSVGADGSQGLLRSGPGQSMSNDARLIAFNSYNQFDPDATYVGGGPWAFVRDRTKGTTRLASVIPETGRAVSTTSTPFISGNGRFVAYVSDDAALPKPAGSLYNVYRYDLRDRKTEIVSVGSNTEVRGPLPATFGSESGFDPISNNGRLVHFATIASDLVPNDRNNRWDHFVRDMETGDVERISVAWYGGELGHRPNGYSGSMSPDGRYVSWQGTQSCTQTDPRYQDQTATDDPHENDGFSCRSISYVHDRRTGAQLLLGRSSTNDLARDCGDSVGDDGVVYGGDLSNQARYAVFMACAHNLKAPGSDPAASAGNHLFVRRLGDSMGVGDLVEGGHLGIAGARNFSTSGVASARDLLDGNALLSQQGADIERVLLAYRSQHEDLFVRIELEHMPKVIPGASPIFYGLRFKVGDKSYEVRATSLDFGTFGLFDCTGGALCSKVADLRGGYGTTGMRVVFSLPLQEIGLKDGGELSDVEAFSGLGSYLTGASKVLDRVRLN